MPDNSEPGRTGTDLAVAVRVGARGVDVRFEVAAGEVLAVLGPNGAGKSTVAAVVAGLLRADAATVTVGGRTLTDTARGVDVAVCERRVGLLSQDPLLFPHLSVLGNVAFAAAGPTGRRGARRTARRIALRWLDAVGAQDLAARRPSQLSGGQAQRVALARALAAEPDVLLLDEPLSALDVAGAAAMRTALRTVIAARERPVVLITHDLPDVAALADRVMVMEAGAVAETGRMADVLAAPRSGFGARIAGLNVVAGTAAGPGVVRSASGHDWHGRAADELDAGTPAVAVFAPAAVTVWCEPPHGSPRNVVAGRVGSLEADGAVIRVRMEEQPGRFPGLAADVTAGAVADLRLEVGREVWFAVKTQAVMLYPVARTQPTATLASRV